MFTVSLNITPSIGTKQVTIIVRQNDPPLPAEPDFSLYIESAIYADQAGFEIPEAPLPQIPCKRIPLDRGLAEPLIERIQSVSVPVRPTPTEGEADGTTFELEFSGDAVTYARFKWWCHLPDCWLDLGQIAAEIVRLADLPEWWNHSEKYLCPAK